MLTIFRLHSMKVHTNIAVSNQMSEQFPQLYVPQIDDRIPRIRSTNPLPASASSTRADQISRKWTVDLGHIKLTKLFGLIISHSNVGMNFHAVQEKNSKHVPI